jgi:S-formylglutathione hydrolase
VTAAIAVRSEHACFGGRTGFYEHASDACAGPMRFAVHLPPAALAGRRVPALYFLAGLGSTEETFMTKAGAQRGASELGLALVACDTSPRSARFPGDADDWDFGQGAGFYLDATRAPWSSAYRMRTYVARELREVVEREFPIDPGARGILGHSMGGHGALTIALTSPGEYRSVSALAPIVAPSRVPWGQKAFAGYLADRASWADHDAVELLRTRRLDGPLLVDQGLADRFLDVQLRPELLEEACARAGQELLLRRHPGYDHGYYFVATFCEDHLRHHARALGVG